MPGRTSVARDTSPKAEIATVRDFNRFYTRLVGALDEAHLHTEFSLAEGRVLFELAHGDAPTASTIVANLGLDPGYLSRLLRRLERRRLIKRTTSARDGRESHVTLTAAGRAAFRKLDTLASEEVGRLIAPLDAAGQRRLVGSLTTIRSLLDSTATATVAPAYILRPPRAGDLGWVIARHGELYEQEYGWNQRFMSLVARVVADYIDSYDPARECCWIAERDGINVGSVFVTKDLKRAGVAKLRLLLVEPSARGLGIGARLVDECTRFARAAGYHTLSLWTNSVLTSARKIYAAAGYTLVRTEDHDTFGVPLTSETWELPL
jgi:DNA-binding MarR family transcriptional regulator/GNAT superfamily N-acetyltransferase